MFVKILKNIILNKKSIEDYKNIFKSCEIMNEDEGLILFKVVLFNDNEINGTYDLEYPDIPDILDIITKKKYPLHFEIINKNLNAHQLNNKTEILNKLVEDELLKSNIILYELLKLEN